MFVRCFLSTDVKMFTCALLGGLMLAWQPAGAAVDHVVVVFKTHFDIGYTDLASNVVQRYRTRMIDDALQVVDRSRALPSPDGYPANRSGRKGAACPPPRCRGGGWRGSAWTLRTPREEEGE